MKKITKIIILTILFLSFYYVETIIITDGSLFNKMIFKEISNSKKNNQILKETNALPIITSDWRFKFTLSQLQEIFKEWALIETLPIDTIPEISNTIGMNNDELRANEILLHIKKYNPKSWVVIDDINLSKWIDKDHFVHLSRPSEGIKQTGKFKEIIKKLNN